MPVNILNLPGLDVVDFRETDTEYHVRATPKAISRLCPSCGPAGKVVIHQQKTLFVRDLPSHGRAVAIHLDVPRLKCHDCVRTFTAVVPEVDADRQMTERLVKWIGRQSLEYPFTEIAKQDGIDEKTVRAIFGEYVAELEKQYQRDTPVILGLDEIYLSRPRGVITNIGDRCLVDMLENRYKKTIVEFLRSLPHPERIQAASTDMYRPYREAIQEVLPHVVHVIDKYHIIRMGNEALEAVRRRMKDTISGKLNLALKRERKLLTMRQHELSDEQWLAVSGWLNNFPQLKTAYDLKERYFRIWDCESPDEAAAEYLRWQEAIPPELAKPFRAITTAWRTWRKQILAYFEHPITNAFTESFNAKIRKAYHEGNGYSFEVLRAKVLFTDVLQRKARRVEQVKVKRRPKFEELEGPRMYMCLGRMTPEEPQYDIRNVVKEVTLGTDLSTLLAEIDHWPTRDFSIGTCLRNPVCTGNPGKLENHMAFNFEVEMHNALVVLGAACNDGRGEVYPLYFDTIGGFLLVHVNEDWVACRFDDVGLAKRKIEKGDINPFSGKWNWHFSRPGPTDVALVVERIKEILMPEGERRVRCPSCFNGEEMCMDKLAPDGYYKGPCRTCGGSSVDPEGRLIPAGEKSGNGLLSVFARKEPTKDSTLISLGMSAKEDVVIYRDQACKHFFARWVWGSDGIPRKNTKRVTLNCWDWNLVWL